MKLALIGRITLTSVIPPIPCMSYEMFRIREAMMGRPEPGYRPKGSWS